MTAQRLLVLLVAITTTACSPRKAVVERPSDLAGAAGALPRAVPLPEPPRGGSATVTSRGGTAPDRVQLEATCLDAGDTVEAPAQALACAQIVAAAKREGQPLPAEVQQKLPALRAELRDEIFAAMRLNRTAFQQAATLRRYGESRPSPNLTRPNPQGGQPATVFAACGLPRSPTGEPLAQYPFVKSLTSPTQNEVSVYNEGDVKSCLDTRSGLAGRRAEPLAQHYYCSLPGVSPELRACFTFQIRVSSSVRHNNHDDVFLGDGTRLRHVKKEWIFAGSQKDFDEARKAKAPGVPFPRALVERAAAYCATDGRAARAIDRMSGTVFWNKTFLDAVPPAERRGPNAKLFADYGSAGDDIKLIDEINPEPTRPLCWVILTQGDLFKLMLSDAMTVYFDRNAQLDIIREYYECDAGRVPVNLQSVYCPADLTHWD